MKLVRYRFDGKIGSGVLIEDIIYARSGEDDHIAPGSRICPLAEARLLAPVQPGKVVAVGKNFREHAEEMNMPIPDEPVLFLKPPSAVIGPLDEIIYPPSASRVDHEAELAVVIGRRARHVSVEEAPRYVLGFTCGNDVTARDLQAKDGQWTRAKSFDTFCPLGPYVVTDLEPCSLMVEARVNGQVRQHSSTANMLFDPFRLVAFISDVMTLEVGDVIMTGTPGGIGPMQVGDVVEVEVEGIGILRNTLVACQEIGC